MVDARTVPRVTLAGRLGVAFWAVFFVLGVQLPFWPLWLASRGLSPELIGVALGLGAWARLLVNPILGAMTDRTGRGRAVAVALALGILATYMLFAVSRGAAPLLVLSFVLGCAFAPIVPLIDATAVNAASRGSLDYGRVRLWGSVAFIAGSVGVGWLLEGTAVDAVLYVLIAATVVLVVALALLPQRGPAPRRHGAPTGVRALLQRPHFKLFLFTSACLHGSHAVLYAYGTPHWLNAGIDESTIGWLWAEGVVAEIVLFSFAPRVAQRLSPGSLMVIAGLGGLVRWPALAMTTAVPWLATAQLLHALTFAATHLSAMRLIQRLAPEHAIAGATTLYSGVATGLAFGVGLPLAGILYKTAGGNAYFAMAIASAVGLASALLLRHRLRSSDAERARGPSTEQK